MSKHFENNQYFDIPPLADERIGSPFAAALTSYRTGEQNFVYAPLRNSSCDPYSPLQKQPAEQKYATIAETRDELDWLENQPHSKSAYKEGDIHSRTLESPQFRQLDKAEINYARAICHATQSGELGKQYVRKLDSLRDELAKAYALYDASKKTYTFSEVCKLFYKDRKGKSDAEFISEKTKEYRSYLQGTYSAYLFNALKENGLVPESVKLSAILPTEPSKETSTPSLG